MRIINAISEVRETTSAQRRNGARVAFVPTMGNLHSGHLALVAKAREVADFVVVSIFVNPLQFGEGEDYAEYPRTQDEDCNALESAGADLLFIPAISQIYPKGPDRTTRVEVPELGDIFCGAHRPGHFAGVATVVCILFNIVGPDVAIFGRKDFQQVMIIRRMVGDLCLGVEILVVNTVREGDGLAKSSRNGYLSMEERATAPLLYRTLSATRERIIAGARDYSVLELSGMQSLSAGGFIPEYFNIRCARDLSLPGKEVAELVVLAAVQLGSTRLIDNTLATAPVNS
ncbi:MAG: pantoate--beta-alanine ligase [Gammaproteobacteria bacterium]|nr:pantoate--beta-alanine ligase [Gammaproteobacteria bacterium]